MGFEPGTCGFEVWTSDNRPPGHQLWVLETRTHILQVQSTALQAIQNCQISLVDLEPYSLKHKAQLVLFDSYYYPVCAVVRTYFGQDNRKCECLNYLFICVES
jgi:hypothetical protein